MLIEKNVTLDSGEVYTRDQVWEFSKITQLKMAVIMVDMELSVVSRTSEWLKI
jgi:hypothetical protein